MTTLTTAPVAPLLDRLFAAAEANSPATNPAFAAITQPRCPLLHKRAVDQGARERDV